MITKANFFSCCLLYFLFAGFLHQLYAGVAPQDSLALVALYNSTDGENWTKNDNWLTGPVSSWEGVSVTSDRVRTLFLPDNNLSWLLPPELGDLTELINLELRGNNLTGPIPTEIGNLHKLTYLVLMNNQLVGPIPAEIGQLQNLEQLNLANNQLTGTIPAEIGDMTQLRSLLLYNNQLSEQIPAAIGNLENLSSFNVSGNQLTGSIPDELWNLTTLTLLSVTRNELSGHLSPNIQNLENLKFLYASSNQFDGMIPATLGELTSLVRLNLSFNTISGSIPAQIGQLINLKTLELNDNELTGGIPFELFEMDSLSYLRLADNLLEDTLSSRIGEMENLVELRLNGNRMSGSLPAELGQLSELKSLYLHENLFSDAVPDDLAGLMHLQNLYLSDNLFMDLPDLSADTSLTKLYIEGNQFTFEDIEPNMGVETFVYAPQDSIGEKQDTLLAEGATFEMSVQVKGSANLYQWMKDGDDIPDALDSTYVITSASGEDAGRYNCKVTNSIANALTLYSRSIDVMVDVADKVQTTDSRPDRFALHQNYPNPFNGNTVIHFDVPEPQWVSLTIYNMAGQRVANLVNKEMQPGQHQVTWSGLDDQGRRASSGVYMYRIQATDFSQKKSMVFLQ